MAGVCNLVGCLRKTSLYLLLLVVVATAVIVVETAVILKISAK
jgi:hypothetical protein